jgi:glycosyltransferase involved in cell wall biosynthesis
MRIVHVLPALTKGGGERVAAELANQAVKEGHEVTIIAAYPVDPNLLQNSLQPAVQVQFVSSSQKNIYAATLQWLKKNRNWLAQQDIIHCHLTYGALFGSLVRMMRKWRRQAKPQVVETYHAVGMPIPPHHRWIHAQLAARRDALVLMAEDDFWNQFRTAHPRLLTKLIPNGVSLSWPAVTAAQKEAYKKTLGLPDSCRYVIGTVGMLRPDRHPRRYIPIFARVAKALGPDVHFVIAGEGPEKEHVLSLVDHYQLRNQVHMAGLVLNPSLPFSVMDLYISLNVGATSGVSMFEAALSNLPVVAIQMTENYVAKPTDWVWSSTSDAAIADRLIHLLQNPEEKNALANRQNTYVQKYHSTEAMAAAYDTLYRSLLMQAHDKQKVSSLTA